MKIGVPTFGYQTFPQFQQRVLAQGYFTANLGDNMQSIAVRLLLARLGVPSDDIVSINRDTLALYDGPPVALVMNGVFAASCFPIPPQVTPVFIGLCVAEKIVIRYREYFSRFQPIGCRDTHTKDVFNKHGIAAFVSGCLTMTLQPRMPVEGADKVLLVYGAGAGAFPAQVLKSVPAPHLDCAEFIFHRIPVMHFPLSDADCIEIEAYARGLLAYYAANAKLVVTPLHHVAAPCMALGIPVVICREQMDSRFTYLNELTKIYTPDIFDSIDWDPAAVDISPQRDQMEALVAASLARLSA